MSKVVVYLKEDHKERFNSKRGWFVKAYRLVDENGEDRVQPWCDSKNEARKLARELGYILHEEVKP